MNGRIKIVIADAQPIFRLGLRQVLESEPRFRIKGEAADGENALKLISDCKPSVAVLGIDLPEKDGFEIARSILANSLPVGVIFFTSKPSRSDFNSALNLGVKGYLLKDSPTSYLIEAVDAVSEKQCFICPALSTMLVNRSRRRGLLLNKTPAVTELSPTERRVLVMVGQYMTSKKIAEEMYISVRTVEHHRENIAAKLGLRGRNSLLKFAINHHNELI